MSPILCSNDRLIEKIGEIIDVPISSQDNVPAASAVATVRPTSRYKFFSPKTDAPSPALSGLCKNFDAINEHAFSALQVERLKRLWHAVRKRFNALAFQRLVQLLGYLCNCSPAKVLFSSFASSLAESFAQLRIFH